MTILVTENKKGQTVTKSSIQHQCKHIEELCAYYTINIVYVSDDHKKQVLADNKAIQDTFKWFRDNEQRIKAALAKTAPAQQGQDQAVVGQARPSGADDKAISREDNKDNKDRVKHAATLCADSAFQNFLKWFWDDKGWGFQPKGSAIDIAAHRVRAITKVKSRAQFNKSERDGRAWDNLFNHFKKWEQYGS